VTAIWRQLAAKDWNSSGYVSIQTRPPVNAIVHLGKFLRSAPPGRIAPDPVVPAFQYYQRRSELGIGISLGHVVGRIERSGRYAISMPPFQAFEEGSGGAYDFFSRAFL
jgi:hypothetical protein